MSCWRYPTRSRTPGPRPAGSVSRFKVDKPRFQLGRLGSIVDPAKDICRGSNNEVFCLDSGMTVLDPTGAGVGLCPLDSPLVSLGHPGLFRYTKDFTPREPTVFVNLYNNQWGTNFQQWIGGKCARLRGPHLGGEEGIERVGPDHALVGSSAALPGGRSSTARRAICRRRKPASNFRGRACW